MPKTNPEYEQVQFIKNDVDYENHKRNSDYVSALKKIEQDRSIDNLTRKERMSVAMSFKDIKNIVNNYKYSKSYSVMNAKHCDLCGTAIFLVFEIKNEFTKKTLNLGSECIVKHNIRIDGYNTVQEIINFVEGEKTRLSNQHRGMLWKQTPEYKKDELGRWLLSIVKHYVARDRIKLPRDYGYGYTSVEDKAWNNKTNDGVWANLPDNDETKTLENKIKAEIKAISFNKTYKVNVPVGRNDKQTINVTFDGNKICKENDMGKISAYDIRNAITNVLWKNKDALTTSQVSSYKKAIRLALMNDKSIIQFVGDYSSYLLKVESVFDKYQKEAEEIVYKKNLPIIEQKKKEEEKRKAAIEQAEIEAIIDEVTEDPVISIIASKKKGDYIKGIILGKEYKGYTHTLENTTSSAKAILVKEVSHSGEERKYWFPKTKIFYDNQNNFLLVPSWLITANKVQGAV
jgi:hypothetical protein